MKSLKQVRVELDLEGITTTIGGRLALDGGAAREFYGWLELIHQLERARAGTRQADARDPEDQQAEATG
jgi:hypothetical protein